LRGYVSRGRVQRAGLFEGFELLEKGTIQQAGVANFLRDLISGAIIISIWVFPKIVVPQNGWFIMENPY